MKNSKHSKMTTSLAISTTLYDPSLLTNIVEELACRRNDSRVSGEIVEPGWQPIGSSSLEAFVSGTAEISNGKDFFKMPFTTCFLFTCIRAKNRDYDLTWASSLS
jgi:hypothetical protein